MAEVAMAQRNPSEQHAKSDKANSPLPRPAPEHTDMEGFEQDNGPSQVGSQQQIALTPPSSDGEHNETRQADKISKPESLADAQKVQTPPKSDIGDQQSPQEPPQETYQGEIKPDHYYGDGKIPVFKPTMEQFRDFKTFIDKVDDYGMRAGVIKVVPPPEWHASLPNLDEAVKTIRVKNPIMQEFSGNSNGIHGAFMQANIEKQRAYNLPQWKALTEESQHQPLARRGERKAAPPSMRGRWKRNPGKSDSPATPKDERVTGTIQEEAIESKETSPPETTESLKPESTDALEIKGKGRPPKRKRGTGAKEKSQMKSISERRKYNKVDQMDYVDEEAFKDFDYRFHGNDEFTPERCQELEKQYWKSLTFAHPMYGADMPGSLFKDDQNIWNVSKLPNLLDVLGQKVPGVNTAYLYLGMWKATFAWHLEDVDLYSINYIHFGAPKQWYSISQEDAGRFENAMKSIWPTDYKNCSQFLRHKTYLISPQVLEQQFKIKVNKMVHNEGEFVITYPYGYHSGYNLGYNCAESVNFATESWLDFGRIAKKCECESDSVWIDIDDIERKLRGEPTPEYYNDYGEGVPPSISMTDELREPPLKKQKKASGPNRKRSDTVAEDGVWKVEFANPITVPVSEFYAHRTPFVKDTRGTGGSVLKAQYPFTSYAVDCQFYFEPLEELMPKPPRQRTKTNAKATKSRILSAPLQNGASGATKRPIESSSPFQHYQQTFSNQQVVQPPQQHQFYSTSFLDRFGGHLPPSSPAAQAYLASLMPVPSAQSSASAPPDNSVSLNESPKQVRSMVKPFEPQAQQTSTWRDEVEGSVEDQRRLSMMSRLMS